MASTRQTSEKGLPGRFEDLVRMVPPHAIADDIDLKNTIDLIDRLMANGTMTKGQTLYLETLVQLVQAYEASHHAISTAGVSGLDSLQHLLNENGMNASDLAQLLGVHASISSKILKGDRSLTIEHLKILSARFKVNASVFID